MLLTTYESDSKEYLSGPKISSDSSKDFLFGTCSSTFSLSDEFENLVNCPSLEKILEKLKIFFFGYTYTQFFISEHFMEYSD
jgi:hypothetical protein